MMERKRITPRKADAILTADNHLTETVPVSRTDDYFLAQQRKLEYLWDLQQQHNCPVLDAGDMFEFWKISPWLAMRAYTLLPRDMVTIPGNHDLPEHSLELFHKSGMALIDRTRDDITVINSDGLMVNIPPFYIQGSPYGYYEELKPFDFPNDGTIRVLLLHETVWFGDEVPWVGAQGYSSKDILREHHRNYDLIVTGDNHNAFVDSYRKCILVNPGSMMRSSVDKADYRPRCYLYYKDTHEVVPSYYPIDEGVHSREHIDRLKDRNDRMAAYISTMNKKYSTGLSFEENLRAYFKQNKTSKLIKEMIWRHRETN